MNYVSFLGMVWFQILNEPPDDPAKFVNAPISIQLVGRTLEEEAVIAMAEIVDAALKAGAAQ